MAENKMAQVAALLGVELGERFKLSGHGDNIYYIDGDGLQRETETSHSHFNTGLAYILLGDYEVVKLPWKPKWNDEYYYISCNGGIYMTNWLNYDTDFCRAIDGNVFRTEAEAEAHRAEVMAKFKEWRS